MRQLVQPRRCAISSTRGFSFSTSALVYRYKVHSKAKVGLKPGNLCLGARVETKRLSAMGQGESTAVQPRLGLEHHARRVLHRHLQLRKLLALLTG
jgi:hypothetical protein